jgi:hypothetical protein
MARARSSRPEIYCDFNAHMTERGYSLERHGSVVALEKMGLTLEQAVGKRFTFYADDGNEAGEPDDLMVDGYVVKDPEWGYLAIAEGDFYQRSELDDA